MLAQQVQPDDEPAGPAGIGWRPGRGLVQNGFDMPVLGRERRDVLGEISLQGGEQPVLLDLGVRTQHGGDPAGELRQARNVRGGTGGPRLADQGRRQGCVPGQLVDSGPWQPQYSQMRSSVRSDYPDGTRLAIGNLMANGTAERVFGPFARPALPGET